MSDNCILCGGDTEQDGFWPVELPNGTIDAGGCLGCFERQSAELWWDMVTQPPSRFRQWIKRLCKALGVPRRIINSGRHGSYAETRITRAETQGRGGREEEL